MFAGNVVNVVLARHGISTRVGSYGSPGGAYYGAYRQAGGSLVGTNDAQPGDLIQTINATQKNSDNPTTSGLHTAIVVALTFTPGTYTVRDSNWSSTNDELAREHAWAPASYASAYIWRFGTVIGGGGYAVALQANTGNLYTYTSDGNFRHVTLGMMDGTSPTLIRN